MTMIPNGRRVVAPSSGPGDVFFFDDFQYVVARDDSSAVSIFESHGWTGGKLENGDAFPGANGWMYTVTSIPGFGGSFPAGGSRALCLEMIPAVEGPFEQTDAWLQLSDLPGDLWIQYWVYPQNHAGSGQLSSINNSCKWFYFAREGYPSGNHALMVLTSCMTHNPLVMVPPDPWGMPSTNGEHVYICGVKAGGSTIDSTAPGWDSESDVGPTTISEYMVPNRWTLVKFHLQTLGTTGNQIELWLTPQGGSTTKVMDYTDGVDGFTFTQPVGGGHSTMRWPAVVDVNDYWMYIQDFAVAENEAALPTY